MVAYYLPLVSLQYRPLRVICSQNLHSTAAAKPTTLAEELSFCRREFFSGQQPLRVQFAELRQFRNQVRRAASRRLRCRLLLCELLLLGLLLRVLLLGNVLLLRLLLSLLLPTVHLSVLHSPGGAGDNSGPGR